MKKFTAILLAALVLMATGCNPNGTPVESTTDAMIETTVFEEETTAPAQEESTTAEEADTAAQDTTEEVTTAAEDSTEAPEEATTQDGSAPVLYQMTMNASYQGNMYLIKTRHGKYILIDGGGADGGGLAVPGSLRRCLRQVTGEQNPEIEAWFLSHVHGDHVTEFTVIGADETPTIQVNNVYMNIPSAERMAAIENGDFLPLYNNVKTAYDHFIGEGEFDKMDGKNAFEGDVFDIDGVRIEVIMTTDDTEGNLNDTSMILKVTIEGQTILFLQDAFVGQTARLLELDGEILKSDIVQMAHHGQNGVSKEVYEKIQPTMCLWPTPDWLFDNIHGHYKTLEVRQWMVDLGVQYHLITGIHLTQSLTFPVDFDALEPYDVTPPPATE